MFFEKVKVIAKTSFGAQKLKEGVRLSGDDDVKLKWSRKGKIYEYKN